MLVLSRKVNERIQVGEGISIVVVRIIGNRVTLGVQAPAEVKILRGEVKPNGGSERGGNERGKVA